jgi:hypothetical protein
MQTLPIVDDDESVRLALPEALSCAGRAIMVYSMDPRAPCRIPVRHGRIPVCTAGFPCATREFPCARPNSRVHGQIPVRHARIPVCTAGFPCATPEFPCARSNSRVHGRIPVRHARIPVRRAGFPCARPDSRAHDRIPVCPLVSPESLILLFEAIRRPSVRHARAAAPARERAQSPPSAAEMFENQTLVQHPTAGRSPELT